MARTVVDVKQEEEEENNWREGGENKVNETGKTLGI